MGKKRTSKRKKKQAGRNFLSEIKRFVAIVCVLLVTGTGLTFVYLHNMPEGNVGRAETSSTDRPIEIAEAKPVAAIGKHKLSEGAEIPQLKNGQIEQIIRHEAYTVSYNENFKIPNWVAYKLTAEMIRNASVKRHNRFIPDPQVKKGATALNEDYTRTGYDRGHMVPAGDMRWSEKVMRETFYFSNICPQDRGLNSGVWNDLESTVRVWAKEHETIYVICGPVIEKELKRLGKNRVGVPLMFYKVVCDPEKAQAIGFLFENRDYKQTSPRDLAVSVDRVEEVTGIDFFPQFPDKIEKKMEANFDPEFWSFIR